MNMLDFPTFLTLLLPAMVCSWSALLFLPIGIGAAVFVMVIVAYYLMLLRNPDTHIVPAMAEASGFGALGMWIMGLFSALAAVLFHFLYFSGFQLKGKGSGQIPEAFQAPMYGLILAVLTIAVFRVLSEMAARKVLDR